MEKMLTQWMETIEHFMLQTAHKPLGYSKYKEMSKHLGRVCDFVNLFATVNQQLIKEEGKVTALL